MSTKNVNDFVDLHLPRQDVLALLATLQRDPLTPWQYVTSVTTNIERQMDEQATWFTTVPITEGYCWFHGSVPGIPTPCTYLVKIVYAPWARATYNGMQGRWLPVHIPADPDAWVIAQDES